MNLIINVAVLGLACTMVVGHTTGGFSSIRSEDTEAVNECRKKIISDIESLESCINPGYNVSAMMRKLNAKRQVVNGTNYKCTCTVTITCESKDGSNCVKKDDVTRTYSATLHKSRNASEPLTYITNQGLKCVN